MLTSIAAYSNSSAWFERAACLLAREQAWPANGRFWPTGAWQRTPLRKRLSREGSGWHLLARTQGFAIRFFFCSHVEGIPAFAVLSLVQELKVLGKGHVKLSKPTLRAGGACVYGYCQAHEACKDLALRWLVSQNLRFRNISS